MQSGQLQLTARLQALLKQARPALVALPQTPEIELFLINQDFPQALLSHEEMLAVLNSPAYWAFCWASGQVLARFVLDEPAWVAGKSVLDFGSGSGVAAIAAARAGARRVIACDSDPDALLATRCNVAHNRVDVEVLEDFYQLQQPVDLIIAGDVLYDRDNLRWLDIFIEHAAQVLVADSRVKDFDFPPYQLLAEGEAGTVPDLDEFDEFRQVKIYHAVGKYAAARCREDKRK
jgi:predicted nicotinamide N-methyase